MISKMETPKNTNDIKWKKWSLCKKSGTLTFKKRKKNNKEITSLTAPVIFMNIKCRRHKDQNMFTLCLLVINVDNNRIIKSSTFICRALFMPT